MNMIKTNLDLVNDCDSFPYDDPFQTKSIAAQAYYTFLLPNDPRPHGLITYDTVNLMPWTADFVIDHSAKSVQLLPKDTKTDISSACNAALSGLINDTNQKDVFSTTRTSEHYPVVGARFPVSIERYSRSLFGIIGRGAHLTVYTRASRGLKIWVPRRSPAISTYPNRLDTTVAGGVSAGEEPFECVVREAAEEASLPDALVRGHARSSGVLSYIGLKNAQGRKREGLVTPDLIYVYDLEVEEEVMLKPEDGEVQEFYLWEVEKVKQELARGEFKTNSALVMIDFLMRHGFITPANDKDYAEIVARMHRRLPLPTTLDWSS